MMGWYGTDWGVAGVVGMLMMLVFWGGVVALAVWAVARLTRNDTHAAPAAEPARAILDRRFASGDLDAEGYAQARRVLEGQPAQSAASPSS